MDLPTLQQPLVPGTLIDDLIYQAVTVLAHDTDVPAGEAPYLVWARSALRLRFSKTLKQHKVST